MIPISKLLECLKTELHTLSARNLGVNEHLENFNDILIRNINKFTPVVEKRVRNVNKNLCWITSDIKSAMKWRDYLKVTQRFSDRIVRNQVVNKIKQAKNNYYREILISSQGNINKMWKYMHMFTKSQPSKM